MTLPLCAPHPGLFRKFRRNVLTSSLSSLYPFITSELTDDDGIVLGRNRQSDSIVMVNNFDTSKYENTNLVILLLNMLMRYRTKGIQTFAIIPKKDDEFLRAVEIILTSRIGFLQGDTVKKNKTDCQSVFF